MTLDSLLDGLPASPSPDAYVPPRCWSKEWHDVECSPGEGCRVARREIAALRGYAEQLRAIARGPITSYITAMGPGHLVVKAAHASLADPQGMDYGPVDHVQRTLLELEQGITSPASQRDALDTLAYYADRMADQLCPHAPCDRTDFANTSKKKKPVA